LPGAGSGVGAVWSPRRGHQRLDQFRPRAAAVPGDQHPGQRRHQRSAQARRRCRRRTSAPPFGPEDSPG